MHKDELYTATYSNPVKVRIGEVDVYMPDIPSDEFIRNIDKPVAEQKYARHIVPDVRKWRQHEIDDYVSAHWHRRLNGEWWMIKGQPHYIPGGALVFFDFWTKKTGGPPDFRYEALQLFQFWYQYIERSPTVFGMYDMKPRRIGDTEKILFIVWERTTRFKNVSAGMQSFTDIEAAKNFSRLAKGNRNLPFFFKPNWSGSDKECLAFMAPNEVMSLKKLKEKAGEISMTSLDSQFLGSYIDFEATVEGKYDGDQLFTYFLDEIFKIPVKMMDARKQWDNMRRVLSLNNEMFIWGKSALCSTVEEKSKGANRGEYAEDSTVEMAEYFWNNSDPNDLDENGRTATGLVRLFRSYELNAPIDEFGMPKIDETRRFRDAKIRALQKKGDFAGILDIKRKEPGSPEDALSQTSDKCPLHPELCMLRLEQIRQGLDRYGNQIKNYRPKVRIGDLVWENGVPGTKVRFIETLRGKWHISQMPIKDNHITKRYIRTPSYTGDTFWGLNGAYYVMGADPFDAREVVGRGSDGAFAVKRKLFLPHEEVDIMFDESGLMPMNVEDMTTNTYICDYKFRPKNPYDFYDDVVKTCWFYGVPVFPEMDKPGLHQWMVQNGYFGLVMFEPQSLVSMGARRKSRQGTKASDNIISAYVDRLKAYVHDYIWNNHHPRIIEQWSRFVPAKRTKYDLAVATGFTELADDDLMKQEETESVGNWENSPYEYYDD